jgi:hypothetical protein
LVSIKEVSDPDDMDAPAADTDDGEDWTTQTYEVAADDVGTPTTMYGIVRFPYDSDTEDCRFHVRITTA